MISYFLSKSQVPKANFKPDLSLLLPLSLPLLLLLPLLFDLLNVVDANGYKGLILKDYMDILKMESPSSTMVIPTT